MFDPSSNSTKQFFISWALQYLWDHENNRDDKKKLDLAVSCFEEALKLGPIGSLNLYQLARAYNWQGNFEKGLECADKSVELDLFHDHGYFIWAVAKAHASKNKNVMQIIDEIQQKMPDNDNHFSDYLKISALYFYIADRAKSCEYLLRALSAAIELGYNEKAVIQKLNIETTFYAYALKLLATENTNNLDQALEAFDVAIQFAIKLDSTKMVAYYCQEAMKICLELSNPEKALEYYVQSQSYPQYACGLLHVLAGKAYLANNHKEKALEAFSKWIELYEKKQLDIEPDFLDYATYAYEQRANILAESNQPQTQPQQASSPSMSSLIGNFSEIMVSAPTNTGAVNNSVSSTSDDQQSRGPGMS